MGIMWQRLTLQRLKAQLQLHPPRLFSALQSEVPAAVTVNEVLKKGAYLRIEGGSKSFSKQGVEVVKEEKLQASADVFSSIQAFPLLALSESVLPKAGSAMLRSAISRKSLSSFQHSQTSGFPEIIKAIFHDSTRVARTVNASSRATTLGRHFSPWQSTAKPLLQNSSVKTPLPESLAPETLLQSPDVRWFHHSTRLQNLETPPTPSKPQNPMKPSGGGARQRLAQESVRKASSASTNMLLYLCAMTVAMVGATYSAVPLYRMFCQATGFGGTVQKKETVEEKIARHSSEKKAVPARQITVQFNADVADGMPWKFTPCQREVKVVPGQSTLAFYTAHNLSDKAITGVSTYNVSPMRAGIYFNKIQCFCFEEQRLRPGEKVDMPVFFYIDPEFAEDVKMKGINLLTLSYTFFKVNEDE